MQQHVATDKVEKMHANQFTPYDELAGKLLPVVQPEEDGAHDISHLARVWNNAKAIQQLEGGDLELIAASVLLHDCVQVPKNSPLREMASRLAAAEARTLLRTLNWETDRIQKVA